MKLKAKRSRSDADDITGPLFKVFAVVHRFGGKLYVTLLGLGALSTETPPDWHAWYDVSDVKRNTYEDWADEFHHKLANHGYASQVYLDDFDESDPWANEIFETATVSPDR